MQGMPRKEADAGIERGLCDQCVRMRQIHMPQEHRTGFIQKKGRRSSGACSKK